MPLITFETGAPSSNASAELPLSKSLGVTSVLIFYSSIVGGQLWCPDCRAVDDLVKTTFENSADKQGIIVYVGDRGVWRDANNKYRKRWKISSIPTLIRLDSEGKEHSRLVESEITPDSLKAFLDD
ncbi:hypothetical protein FRB95_008236 [Tulasnella sp. JGI-2019a]|nr:hypothetical protein FRB95_008236 [Tulasnella sp. JGI-2019a]